MNRLKKCVKCELCKNQSPLVDQLKKSDVMWIGISSKRVENVDIDIPLSNNTNTGKIIEMVEKANPTTTFYKTNLVKCPPIDKNNKLRYPTFEELQICLPNLEYEINIVQPKIIFVLGKRYNKFVQRYVEKFLDENSKVFYVEHPSYIYIYKRKQVGNYILKLSNFIKTNEI